MQRFEFSDEKSNKFWQVAQHGCELHLQWGKIGTKGQSQVKAFDTEAKAEVAKAKLVAEKTGKGYVPVGASTAPATPVTAPKPTRIARPAAPSTSAAAPSPPSAPATPAASHEPAQPVANGSAATPQTATPAATSAAKDATAGAAMAGRGAPDTVSDGVQGDSGHAAAVAGEEGRDAASDDAAQAIAGMAKGPSVSPDAINAWLAARQDARSVDRQALAAWRELLALAEAEPALWFSKEASALQKRFGIDADAASMVCQWRAGLMGSTEWAALWREDASMAQLDAQMSAVLAAAWQPLLADEPERAAQPTLAAQGEAMRHGVLSVCDTRAARFGQFMPDVPLGPVFSPVAGDSSQAAWRALQGQWPQASLPAPEHSDTGFAQDVARVQAAIAQARIALSSAAPPEVGHAGWPLLLCVACWLGEGDQGLDDGLPARMREAFKQRLPSTVGGQLWHVLRHTHTVVQRWQLLVESMAFDVWWLRHSSGQPIAAHVSNGSHRGNSLHNPTLARMRQDLLAASEAERAECLALFQQADVPFDQLPVLAWVWRDVADVSDRCVARFGQTKATKVRETSVWIAALLRDPAQLAELALDPHEHIPVAMADAMLQRLGAAALPVLLPSMSHYDAPLEALTRLNHPEAVLMLMRHTSPSNKAHMALLRRAMRRWPLAALVAATQLAQQGQGSGKQAATGVGLVRQLLAEVGPALPLVQPWLSAPAWRWLSQLVTATQPAQEADARALAAQVAVLSSPPWLQKRKAKADPVVSGLMPPAVPDGVLMWPEAERHELLSDLQQATQQARTPEQVAMGLAIWERSHQGPHTKAVAAQWQEWIASGDVAPFVASWLQELARVRAASRYAWDQVWGYRIALLPQAVGVAFFEGVADQVDVIDPEVLLAHWGDAVLAGMVKLAIKRPAEVAEYSHRMGTTALALWAAKLGFASKQPAPRAQGQRWLTQWPRHAAAGLLLPALQGTAAEQEAAGKALRWLHARGHAEALAEVAAQFCGGNGLAALQAVLARDPLDLFPAKFAKTLPDFWQPDTWSRPQLRSGEHLPLSAMNPLGQMLSFARPDGVYAGLEQVRAACTPESLGAFAWDLFSAWLAAGAGAKDNWAFTALGVLGDAVCVQRLRPLMKSWPEESASARASLGLQVLAEMGTTAALRLMADVADRDKPKGLVARAQALLTEVAEARGLTLEDLQDRLVPDMGLDARGQTVLDYGPRQFLLTLDENLKPFLRKLENGKPGARLKSQPAKNTADDPAMAVQAIERFKAIKAQADAVAKVQLKRFEQAMVTGRRWCRADFEQLYVQQPLLRLLASRLVWGVFETVDGPQAAAARASSLRHRPERLHQLLRLSDDGSLSTADDAVWAWPPETEPADAAEADTEADANADADAASLAASRWQIGLAHPLEMDEGDVAEFAQALADYELMQPFEQLSRPVSRAPAVQARAQLQAIREAEVARFTAAGNVSGPRRLLGLKSRGWTLSTDDGYTYEGATRELPDGGVVVVQTAPGVSLYEINQAPPQTIRALHLHAQRGSSNSWGELDAITHSELMRDMAYLAQL